MAEDNVPSFLDAYEAITNPSVSAPLPRPAVTATSRPSAPLAAQNRPRKALKPGAIAVSKSQSGNPLLTHLSSFSVADHDMIEDFALSDTCSSLFLSVKFHKLSPQYIGKRMEAMRRKVKTQVLVVHVDDADCEKCLLEIHGLAMAFHFVVVLAWSLQEAARYLEAYAKYSVTGATSIKLLEGKQATDLNVKTVEILTTSTFVPFYKALRVFVFAQLVLPSSSNSCAHCKKK